MSENTVTGLPQEIENVLVEKYAQATQRVLSVFNELKMGAADGTLIAIIVGEYLHAGIDGGPEALDEFDLLYTIRKQIAWALTTLDNPVIPAAALHSRGNWAKLNAAAPLCPRCQIKMTRTTFVDPVHRDPGYYCKCGEYLLDAKAPPLYVSMPCGYEVPNESAQHSSASISGERFPGQLTDPEPPEAA